MSTKECETGNENMLNISNFNINKFIIQHQQAHKYS